MKIVNLVLHINAPQCPSHIGCGVSVLLLSGLVQLWKILVDPLGKYEDAAWVLKA